MRGNSEDNAVCAEKRLTIGVHSQTLNRPDGMISGSEITTAGLMKAFLRNPRVIEVKRYGPGHYSTLHYDQIDLFIIEGWSEQLRDVINILRETNPNCVILFWNLSFLNFEEVINFDVDGYLTNSEKNLALLSQRKPTIFLMLASDPAEFQKTDIVDEYRHDVVYLGLYHPNKSHHVIDLILGEATQFDFALYGTEWGVTRYFQGGGKALYQKVILPNCTALQVSCLVPLKTDNVLQG